jgi:thiopurine S-methyltransferase
MSSEDMDWQLAWEQGNIGWHREGVNTALHDHIQQLDLQQGDTLFFPLCGASLDMKYALDQGYHVKGVELVSLAIERFFDENEIAYKKVDNVYYGDRITLYCCDVFDLLSNELSDVKAIFDRGALVALPEILRTKYFAHLKMYCSHDIKILAEVFDYDQKLLAGPPFSVSQDYLVAQLDEYDTLEEIPHYKEPIERAGVGGIELRVYLIQLKDAVI